MKKVAGYGLLVGLVLLLVSFVVMPLTDMIVPGLKAQYMNPMFRPWSDPLMQMFILYPFILGLAYAYVWDRVKGVLKGGVVAKACQFALGIVVIATIPGMFVTYSSFAISLAMVLSWTISGLINVLVAGLMLGKLNS